MYVYPSIFDYEIPITQTFQVVHKLVKYSSNLDLCHTAIANRFKYYQIQLQIFAIGLHHPQVIEREREIRKSGRLQNVEQVQF